VDWSIKNEDLKTVYVELRSIPRIIIKYSSTLAKQVLVRQDPFAEPIPIFNNIEGGYGNFSGFSPNVCPQNCHTSPSYQVFYLDKHRGCHMKLCLMPDKHPFDIESELMKTSALEVLESIPFFAVLSQKDMESLAQQMELATAPKHSFIYAEGDAADHFYILAEGSIKIGTHHEDGREVIKQVLHPQDDIWRNGTHPAK
jgi:hypothetical protein